MKLSVVSSYPSPRRRLPQGAGPAFTLIELLVSVTFLVILMLVVTQVIGIVQRSWVRANSRVSQFREARQAFDALSRSLSQATLNNYWDNEFDDSQGKDAAGQQISFARGYFRQSELQFVCGPTSQVIPAAAGNAQDYPGHAVFFQAPLGIANLVATVGTGATPADPVNTENMVNLLCGRGYFVEWGSDTSFRPPFLEALGTTVPIRYRLRLMEYSPTAEKNQIYDTSLRPITAHSKEWFRDVLTNVTTAAETTQSRAFTRPIAENIIALVISSQVEVTGNTGMEPYVIAPEYVYDSTLKLNPGATPVNPSPQGTQHLLPPILKVSMVALDERSGEFLARGENNEKRAELLGSISNLLQNAATLGAELDGVDGKLGTIPALLLAQKLEYRIFSTTIALKQARWSF